MFISVYCRVLGEPGVMFAKFSPIEWLWFWKISALNVPPAITIVLAERTYPAVSL